MYPSAVFVQCPGFGFRYAVGGWWICSGMVWLDGVCVGWTGGNCCGGEVVEEDIVVVSSQNPRFSSSHVGGLRVGVGSHSGCDWNMVCGCNCAA